MCTQNLCFEKKIYQSFSTENIQFVQLKKSVYCMGMFSQYTPQCWAFSRALKTEKLIGPLFPGPRGAVDTNEWCIIHKQTLKGFQLQLFQHCENNSLFGLSGWLYLKHFLHVMTS